MKRVLAITALLLVAGCNSPQPPPRDVAQLPDRAPLIGEQTAKDEAVVGAADRIDTAVSGHTVEPQVKAETATIRNAVQQAPASKINVLLDAWQRHYDKLAEINGRLHDIIADLQGEARKQQILWFNIAGFALLGVFAASMWLGGGLLGAKKHAPLLALSGLCFGMARIAGSKWFDYGVYAGLAIVAAYVVWVLLNDRRSAQEKAELSHRHSVLRKIVPVMDTAKRHASADNAAFLKQYILDPLGDMMTDEDKAFIKKLRRESNPTA